MDELKMNANELADLLETTESTNNKAAAMLRQQQAEIENLKANLEHVHGIGEADGFIKGYKTAIAKTLTDKEIGQIFADNLCFMVRSKEDADNLIECAKAILKKAQEK